MEKMQVHIKEDSWLARLAARKLKTAKVAMVIGSTIHLWNTTAMQFLSNDSWVNHELAHVKQFRDHGFTGFLAKYILESLSKGYRNNKFEVEARQNEANYSLRDEYVLPDTGFK